MTCTRMVLSLAVCLCLTTAATARDLFVNNVLGDDRRPGTSQEVTGDNGPFRSITRALKSARAGDRVVVVKTNKPYRESISIQAGRHSGTADAPFRLISNGAILDGCREVPVDQWKYFDQGVYRYRPPGLTRQILYVNGKPGPQVKVKRGQALPKLEPLQWCFLGGYLYFRPEKGKTPAEYDLTHTHLRVGITIYEVQNVVISGFTVQGYELDGVNAHDSVFNGVITNVTCRGNARSGISIGGASRVRLQGCLLGNNGEAQLRTEGFSTTDITNCDIIGNTAPRIQREGGQINEKAKDKPAARVGDTPRDVFIR